MKYKFDQTALKGSKMLTQAYSTSFSLGIRFLASRFHNPIYAIYGYVRLADEIVDSFHGYDQEKMLQQLRQDTIQAISEGISINPVIHAFQEVVNQYHIEWDLIDTFLKSMQMDLSKQQYNHHEYEVYILGSAEVVGLMCLRVFMEGNHQEYERLKPYAMKLGSALQKINFLRDLNADQHALGRQYFPQLLNGQFTEAVKQEIEADIEADFELGYQGIKMLPKDARFGVYVAYIYYSKLLNKIRQIPATVIMQERVRISDQRKYALFCSSLFRHSFNLL